MSDHCYNIKTNLLLDGLSLLRGGEVMSNSLRLPDPGKYWRLLEPGEHTSEGHVVVQGYVMRQDSIGAYMCSWECAGFAPTLVREDYSLDRIYSVCRVPDYADLPISIQEHPYKHVYWQKLVDGGSTDQALSVFLARIKASVVYFLNELLPDMETE